MACLVEVPRGMKILQVTHTVDPRAGGTTEALKQLSLALVRQGVEVEILCLDDPHAPWISGFPAPLTALGPGRGTYGYTSNLIPWLRDHASNYDVIVVNGLWQFCGLAVWQIARGAEIPYVVFPHGMLDPWFKRYYPLKHLKKWLYWPWGEYRVLRDAAAVYFTSEAERKDARESFWLYQCREKVCGFGIDAPPFDATAARAAFLARFPDLAEKRLLLFLGRLHEKKGFDLLLRAFQQIISRPRFSPDLHLIMAGPYDSPYGEAMVRLSQALNLAAHLTWTGMLTGAEKWGAFGAAEVFVLPSHQENFGVSVVEALASGCPVLISNKVNIWAEIVEANAGFADTDDMEGTTRLLERWLTLDEAGRKATRESALKCYARDFQVDEVAKRLLIDMEARILSR